jgi:hypothetical protein
MGVARVGQAVFVGAAVTSGWLVFVGTAVIADVTVTSDVEIFVGSAGIVVSLAAGCGV